MGPHQIGLMQLLAKVQKIRSWHFRPLLVKHLGFFLTEMLKFRRLLFNNLSGKISWSFGHPVFRIPDLWAPYIIISMTMKMVGPEKNYLCFMFYRPDTNDNFNG